MGRMALTAAGSIAGGIILPGIGASIGGAIGGLAGAMLFPPPPVYGPRLDDTKVAPGSHGGPIGICYGLSSFQADLIWVEGNEIKEVKQKSGGKGGPSYVTYEYFATFAVLICDTGIAGVRRIWAGKELIFDGTSETIDEAIDANNELVSGASLPLTGPAEGVTLRTYTGTSSQDPDPSIQAEDEHAPAWRGMAYLVFEDLPLEAYANQIPPIFVEVVEAGAANSTYVGLESSGVSSPRNDSFDPSRLRMFVGTGFTTHIYDMGAGHKTRIDTISGHANPWYDASYHTSRSLATEISSGGSLTMGGVPPAIAPDGSFYIKPGYDDGASDVWWGFSVMVDAETGVVLGVLSTVTNLAVNESFGFTGSGARSFDMHPHDMKVRQVDSIPATEAEVGYPNYVYLDARTKGNIHYGVLSYGSRGAIAIDGWAEISDVASTYSTTRALRLDTDGAGQNIFAAYQSSDTGGPTKLCKIPYDPLFLATPGAPNVPTSTVTLSASAGVPREVHYYNAADTVVVVCREGVAIYDADLNLISEYFPGETQYNFEAQRGMGADAFPDGKIWFGADETATGANANTLLSVDLETGALERVALSTWGLSDDTDWDSVYYNGTNWFGHAGSGGDPGDLSSQPFVLFGPAIGVTKVPLADVLEDAALRSGMETANLDLTAVTREIYGAGQKAKNVTARGIWEDLLLHTGHEAMMVDGQLTVRPRATSVTGTLDEDDLGANGAPAMVRRTNPASITRRVEVTYHSVAAQLEPAQQADEFPLEVVPDGDVQRFETALVMDDDEAWDDTQRLLAIGASERTEIEAEVPYTRGELEVGQIWTLSVDSLTQDMRLSEIAFGLVAKLKGTAAWPFVSGSATPVDSTRPAPTLESLSATDYALIDAHIWRDEDDSAALTVAGWPRRSNARWNGGVIYHGPDPASTADEFALLTVAAPAGVATGALGDVPSCGSWDRANTLTVTMLSGTPETATEAEVLQGANPVWVECGATGEWELVQFATATENADGSWTLSNLLRGRRGTEHLTGDHASGDRVIWAESASAKRAGGSYLGTQRHYISATVGGSQDSTTRKALTNRGRGLRPYSPVRVRGSRDGSGNLTITWLRRSRITGIVWRSTRPLGEAAEAYEVDVLDGTGAVVRTIDGLASETASYSAADQTTDFGSAQASVDVKVYQISDTFGRGVPREATV